MDLGFRQQVAIFLLVISLLWFLSASGICREDDTASIDTDKYSVVSVPAENLSGFWGKPIKHLRLFAMLAGKLQPIPYQIDERDYNGRLTTPSYKYPQEGIWGTLGQYDELVFMGRDLGSKAKGRIAEEKYYEIEVTLSSRKQGWAYLRYFPENPPEPATDDYCKYIPAKDKVITNEYAVTFDRNCHMMPRELKLGSEAAGGGNYVGEPHFLIEFGQKGNLGYFRRGEEEFTARMMGYIDGPIRVVRRIKNAVLFNRFIGGLSYEVESCFYDGWFTAPMAFRFPKNLVGIFGFKPRLSFYYHLTSGSENERIIYLNQHNQDGIPLDAVPDAINQAAYSWFGLRRPGQKGAVVTLLKWRPKVGAWRLLWISDTEKKKGSEKNLQGASSAYVGWQTEELNLLRGGKVEIEQLFVIQEEIRPHEITGKISDYLPEPQVTIREMSSKAQ